MDVEEYSRLALRSEAPVGKATMERMLEMEAFPSVVRDVAQQADQHKRRIFYAEPGCPFHETSIHKRVLRRLHGVLGLQSEIGELDESLLSGNLTNVLEELGDILWYVNLIADDVGFTLAQVMEANLAKLERRHEGEFDIERNANRDLDGEIEAMRGFAEDE